jgi:hypothetical protein
MVQYHGVKSGDTRTKFSASIEAICEELPQENPLPAEGKPRWCAGCGKAHAGAVDVKSKKCEGCGVKHAAFGLPAEGKRRWCAGCAKAHAGVVDGTRGKTWKADAGVVDQICRLGAK